MTKEERRQLLTNARLACKRLGGYEFSVEEACRFQQRTYPNLGFFCYTLEELTAHLISGFKLLDEKEQKQAKDGKKGAIHGAKGGRPPKRTKAGA